MLSSVDLAIDLLLETGVIDQAIDLFGLTDDPREAGYILPDGRMLDFSGKNQGGQPGVRALDHRDVNAIMSAGGTEGMNEFMRSTGAIRFHLIDGDIAASTIARMTDIQMKTLAALSRVGSFLLFDFYSGSGTSVKYDIEIDPINSKTDVYKALVKANEQLG